LNGVRYNKGWKNRWGRFLVEMMWNMVYNNWNMFVIMTCNVEGVVDNGTSTYREKSIKILVELLINKGAWLCV
jgi:hypothetical protein